MNYRDPRLSDLSNLESSNLENGKIITLGKCSRFYLLILGSGFFKLFSLFLVGYKNVTDNGIGLFGFCPTFIEFNFIQSIINYFGYIVFGTIFLIFKDVKKVEINDLVQKKRIIKRKIIGNKDTKENSKLKIAKLFLLCFAFVLYIEVKKVLYIEGFQFFNFWTVEIILILHFMRKYFIMDFYKHHKISIIFIILICSGLLLAASFIPNTTFGENSGNVYQNIKTQLGSYFYSILFIFIFIILSYIYAFSRVYSKILMQIKFISLYKIILTIGIIGFIISILASIVSYFIEYRDNFNNYFSAMKEVLKGEKKYKF